MTQSGAYAPGQHKVKGSAAIINSVSLKSSPTSRITACKDTAAASTLNCRDVFPPPLNTRTRFLCQQAAFHNGDDRLLKYISATVPPARAQGSGGTEPSAAQHSPQRLAAPSPRPRSHPPAR